jgi:REP element-mobilizing transposase RayT
MTYNPRKHHRRSIRLPGYDYTQAGAYFVTFVAHDRECLFGEVVDGVMRLNAFGEIVRDEWFRTAVVRPYVMLDPDEFVVMPNHVHGIIWIVRDHHRDDTGRGDAAGGPVGAQRRCAPTDTHTDIDTNASAATTTPTQHPIHGVTPTNVIPGSLGAIVRATKSAATKRINALRGTPAAPVPGRNDDEHIIRYETSLNRIRRYIAANPSQWAEDHEHPRHPLRRRAT